LARAVTAALGAARAALLARHGVIAVTETIPDALAIAAAVEHQATVAWLLRSERSDRPRSRDALAL
jgi:ribulose-5-phosphate 4-epimerase/fuculose-1-phosphate aldolase